MSVPIPTVAEGWVGDNGVEARLPGRVWLPHHFPLVEEGVAVEDFEFGVLHPVEQHVHAGEVVGGDDLLLAVDFLPMPPVSTSLPTFTCVQPQAKALSTLISFHDLPNSSIYRTGSSHR